MHVCVSKMEKLRSYQGWIGQFHEWRESFRERLTNWRQENPETVIELLKKQVRSKSATHDSSDFSHIYRKVMQLLSLFLLFIQFVYEFDLIWEKWHFPFGNMCSVLELSRIYLCRFVRCVHCACEWAIFLLRMLYSIQINSNEYIFLRN